MSLTQDLFGVTQTIPQTDEKDWGDEVTAIISKLIFGVDGLMWKLASNVSLLKLLATSDSLAAGATLTRTHPWHRIASTGGAVSLNGTTAIADGSIDGELLLLTGTSTANTVELPNSANTMLNGPCILELNQAILLAWNTDLGMWEELYRKM